MRRVMMLGALSSGALLCATLVAPTSASADCEAATKEEWAQIDVLLRPPRVAEILGVDGWLIDSNEERFKRGYRLCWDPEPEGEQKGVVWYEQESNLSYRVDIRDM